MALILRTCAADMSAYNGFVWPVSGPVQCPDWKPDPVCGNGLHGALWGEGDGSLFSWEADAKWLVVDVADADIIDLGGKVKFPAGEVVFCGDRVGATDYLAARLPKDRQYAVIGRTFAVGDYGTATAGYGGTALAGVYGTATAGVYGTATAGDCGTATTGVYGTATAGHTGTAKVGDYGTATAGHTGTATAGVYGTATAGYAGTATAGYRGTATSGNHGTATSGDYGTATSGDHGTAKAGACGTAKAGRHGTASAGEGGCILLEWSPKNSNVRRFVVGYVGQKLKADTFYRLDDKHRFIEVETSTG